MDRLEQTTVQYWEIRQVGALLKSEGIKDQHFTIVGKDGEEYGGTIDANGELWPDEPYRA